MVPKELIPIVAAYIGCRYRYEIFVKDTPFDNISNTAPSGGIFPSNGWVERIGWLTTEQLNDRCSKYYDQYGAAKSRNLKLRLRDIESITEKEAKDVYFVLVGGRSRSDSDYAKTVKAMFSVHEGLAMFLRWRDLPIQNIISFFSRIRSFGICIDKELIEAGLVEIVKTESDVTASK